MSELKVLHIVPWFPHPENTVDGIFMAKHIEALQKHCKNRVLHLKFGKKHTTALNLTYEGISLDRITLKPLIDKWRLKEILAAKTIKKYLKKNETAFDIVNFYIAYPNAIGIAKLKAIFPSIKFVITEQWSAYHTAFDLAPEHKGRERISGIFTNNIPLFVVSKALGEDIRQFTQQPNLSFSIIPNIVDDESFYYKPKLQADSFNFCSINNWSEMKNPILLLEAFQLLNQQYPHTRLVLAGSGQLDQAIIAKITALKLENSVRVLGRIDKKEVVNCLQGANVYCQSSNYETFSAICIEALATGTPVIATNIGGMKDFITSKNGRLVDEMTPISWKNEMENVLLNYDAFSFQAISETCIKTYNARKIGQLFFESLLKIRDEK